MPQIFFLMLKLSTSDGIYEALEGLLRVYVRRRYIWPNKEVGKS